MISIFALALALPLAAQAYTDRPIAVGIAELSCVATNGVTVQLLEASSTEKVATAVAKIGFAKKKFTAVLEEGPGNQVLLGLDSMGVNYKTTAPFLDLVSKETQVFSGPMIRYINAPVAVPVAVLTCKIKLQ